MRVAHGRSGIAMPEQLLHLIQRVPGVDEKTGKRMAEIVDAYPEEAQLPPDTIPEGVDIGKRPAPFPARKKPRRIVAARNGANNTRRLVRQGDVPGLSRLGEGNDKHTPLQMDMLPAGLEYFTFACAGQKQQTERRRFRPVAVPQRLHEFARLSGRQRAILTSKGFQRSYAEAGRFVSP